MWIQLCKSKEKFQNKSNSLAIIVNYQQQQQQKLDLIAWDI